MGVSSSSQFSYDSTWEEDEPTPEEKPSCSRGSRERLIPQRYPGTASNQQNAKPAKFKYKYMYSKTARDMQDYRHHYRHSDLGHQINPEKMPNLNFYQNKEKFEPKGLYIEDLLEEWKENYNELEKNHSFIQWLFPLQEFGKNWHATPLHEAEIKEMKRDGDVMKRFLEAYKLMLRFYGLKLQNEETGEITRTENWEERYQNLNENEHNNLRITRILKSLGELGYERYQAPLVRFFLEETLIHGRLQKVKSSVLDYFMFSVRDKKKRQDLVRFAYQHYRPKSDFIWGPAELLHNGGHEVPLIASTSDEEKTTSLWCICCTCG